MTNTLENVAAEEQLDQQQLAERLLARAKDQGVDLVGPNGLLNQLSKKVLETAPEEPEPAIIHLSSYAAPCLESRGRTLKNRARPEGPNYASTGSGMYKS